MRYWPALDGLRGLAVLAVMLFHAQVPQVRGGFLGVDIFFVLSGFLITSQLLREVHIAGRIRWGRLFSRRLIRLQPALLVLLLVLLSAHWAAMFGITRWKRKSARWSRLVAGLAGHMAA